MTADLVFTGGPVLTVDRRGPRAEAVCVADGRIVLVGSAAAAREHTGPRTEVVDLDGRTLLPGFQDAHVHVATSGLAQSQCDLRAAASPDEYPAVIRRYAAAHPDAEWVIGDGWGADDFDGAAPTRQLLDEIVPDRPAYLETADAHSAWVNSRALERAGIGPATPDPPGGVIERDEHGAPSGILHEHARHLVLEHVPPATHEDWEQGILRGQRVLHEHGITACQEASLAPYLFEPYRALAERGALTIRLEGNLLWEDTRGDEQLDELLERRERGTVGRMRIRGVKLFQDGVAESFTAAMLEPYRDRDGNVTANTGLSLFEPERLRRDVTLLDAHGLQVHVHAIGDRAVREALDAIEAAARVNGRRDARHHLAHVQFVHGDDVPRFAALGVTANVTPLWAVASGYVEELTLPFVSEQAGASMYPFGSLARAGARLAFGSDWSVSSPDPLLQVAVAALRRLPGERVGPFLPEQRLGVEAALEAATLGSAHVNHLEHETGSIEAGKLADLVVLDRDVSALDADALAGAKVAATLVAGHVVHAAADSGLA